MVASVCHIMVMNIVVEINFKILMLNLNNSIVEYGLDKRNM